MDLETKEYLLRLTSIIDTVFSQTDSNIGDWLQNDIDKLISDLKSE